MKMVNIDWDTDNDKEILETLPTEVEIPKGIYEVDEVVDWVSDKNGFCIFNFHMEYTKNDVNNYLEESLKNSDLEGFEIPEEDIESLLEQANECEDLVEAVEDYLEKMNELLSMDVDDFDLQDE